MGVVCSTLTGAICFPYSRGLVFFFFCPILHKFSYSLTHTRVRAHAGARPRSHSTALSVRDWTLSFVVVVVVVVVFVVCLGFSFRRNNRCAGRSSPLNVSITTRIRRAGINIMMFV